MINSMEEYPHNGPIENYNPTFNEIVSFLRKAICDVNDDIYAYNWLALGENDTEVYLLLVGWSTGFDEEEYADTEGCALCAKICIDTNAVGSEYDDFEEPYTVNGDVWDTNCEISRDPTSPSIETDANWFLKQWNAFVEAYMDSEEFLSSEEYYLNKYSDNN